MSPSGGTPASAATRSAHAPAASTISPACSVVAVGEPDPPARAVAAQRDDPGRRADGAAAGPQPAQVGGVQGGDVDVGGGLGERRGADLAQGRAAPAGLVGVDGDGRVRLARTLGDLRGERRLAPSASDAVQSTGRGASSGGASQLGGQGREPRARGRDQRADGGDPVPRDPGGRRPRRRVRAERGLGLQQHHGPGRRQLVGDRGAGDAAADDGDVRRSRHPFTVIRSRGERCGAPRPRRMRM